MRGQSPGRWPRFRLRALLAMVAVSALATWAGVRVFPRARVLWARSAEMREMADFIASNRRIDLRLAGEHEGRAESLKPQARPAKGAAPGELGRELREAEYFRRMARYHGELERCYRAAAARPWRPLPPLPEAPTAP